MSYLNSTTGDKSSKRLMGMIYMFVGLGMALVDQITTYKASFDIWITVVVTGASLLGISLLEYFSKLKSNKNGE